MRNIHIELYAIDLHGLFPLFCLLNVKTTHAANFNKID